MREKPAGSPTMTLDFFARFCEHAQRRPGQVVLQSITETGRESFTYWQVASEVRKISLLLQRSGVNPGDAVGLLMENHPRWGIAFLAAQSAGAVIVPLDVLHSAETLGGLIRHAGCKLLIVSRRLLELAKGIRQCSPDPLPVLVAGGSVEGFAGWDTAPGEAGETAPVPLAPRGLDDDLLIMYTSGTTGNPKGVVLTQRNVYRNVVELLRVVEARPDDHFLSVLPLYHVLALMTNFIIPLYVGARVTYLQVLEAQRILQTFREEGISIFVCVPQFYYLVHRRIFQEIARRGALAGFAFRSLLSLSRLANTRLGRNPGRRLFSAVHKPFGPRFRLLAVGGARFDRQVAESFRDLGFNLAQAYGLTETAALVTAAPPVAEAVGSVGRPLPHVEIRIDQPDEHGIGEILIRGENLMRGYWKNPEATAEAIRDGWFHSGDLGYQDARGYLYITGRKKDVIVLSSGKNIYPDEVEHFYQSNCPLIKEICVLGRRDPASAAGEDVLHAVIVPDFDYLRANGIVNARDGVRWHVETLSQRLPPHKRIRSFEIRKELLPRTTTRKLKRFQLAQETDRQAEPPPDAASVPETLVERKILELIRQVKPGAPFGRQLHLELDLGLTSLERVELLYGVKEEFGIVISEEDASKIFTVGDLAAEVEGRLSGAAKTGEEQRGGWAELLESPLAPDDERKMRSILAPRSALNVLYFVAVKCLRLLFAVLFRLKFSGRRHLPAGGPYLICPNHVSFLDAFLLISGLPYRVLSRLFILGESDYFRNPAARLVGRIARVVPVSQDRGTGQSLRLAAEGLRNGMILCVFPEGERSIDGELKPFRTGPALLAATLGVAVAPVGIRGAWEVWPRGSKRIRLKPVSIAFGPPLRPESEESPASFNQRVFESVRMLSGG